jgi:hypothetical protein
MAQNNGDDCLPFVDPEIDSQTLERAHTILERRKQGSGYYEIALELKLPIAEVKRIEKQARGVFLSDSADIEADRCLRLAQLNDVVKAASAIMRNSDNSMERLKACDCMLKAVAAIGKLTGLESTNTLNLSAEFFRDLQIIQPSLFPNGHNRS